MKVEHGIRDEHIEDAIEMYTIAFESKSLYFMEDRDIMKRMVRRNFNPKLAITIMSEDNRLMGLVAYHFENKMMFNLSAFTFFKEFGFFKGFYKILLFWFIFRRKIRNDEMYVDHIVVASELRNKGVGKLLIAELEKLAKEHSYAYIGLDVIEENQRALRLYQILNFQIVKYQKVPAWIAKLIGTRGVNSMLKSV